MRKFLKSLIHNLIFSVSFLLISTILIFICFWGYRGYLGIGCSFYAFLGNIVGTSSCAIVSVIACFIAQNIYSRIKEKRTLEREEYKLIKSQRQRIQVLDRFDKIRLPIDWLTGKRSIYESIIEVLARAQKISTESRKHKSIVKCLLCSPALDYDYDEKNPHAWGTKSGNYLDTLCANPNIHLEITYLPDCFVAGHNPIEDFIAVLADYCSPKNDTKKFMDIYANINAARKRIVKSLEAFKEKGKCTIKHKINIPFQIVLVLDDEIRDVVVAFAGREIIESGKKDVLKGFRSSDPYVVNAFSDIYDTYVPTYTRRPFPPVHTIKIEKELKKRSKTILIKNYLGDNLPESLDFKVYPNVFCPSICNSSKFTSFVLAKNASYLKGKMVLDIGSGTGVQAMVAAISGASKVVASEQNDNAFDNLKDNIKNLENKYSKYNKIIEPIKGNLFSSITEYKGLFDVIIGDMPFVNAKLDQNSPIYQCLYDNNHDLHKLLLTKSKDYIKESGRLYTSFSTLGGPEDVEFFENLIHKTDWHVLCKHTFFEDDYGWIVYELSPDKIIDKRYWWKFLCVNNTEEQIQSKSTTPT